MKPAEAAKAPVAPLEEAVAPPAAGAPPRPIADELALQPVRPARGVGRVRRRVGAMAGALGTAVIARRSRRRRRRRSAAIDLTAVRDIDREPAHRAVVDQVERRQQQPQRQRAVRQVHRAPRAHRPRPGGARGAAQAGDGSDRAAEKRAQAQAGQTHRLGAAAAGRSRAPAAAGCRQPAEPPRPRVLDGWTVRHVSRGVAVIQGRRMGAIEVEAGDVVPGVGRIEFDPPSGRPLGRGHLQRHDHVADDRARRRQHHSRMRDARANARALAFFATHEPSFSRGDTPPRLANLPLT